MGQSRDPTVYGSPAHHAAIHKMAAKGLLHKPCPPCNQCKIHSLTTATIWWSCYAHRQIVIEVRRAELVPPGVSRESWGKFWRVLKATLLEVNFATTTFTSRNKPAITTDLSDCGLKLNMLEVQGTRNALIYCNRHQSSFIKTGICAVHWFNKKPR